MTYTFDRSRSAVADGASVMPGGVGSEFRAGVSPTPLVLTSAEGPYVVDADGNRLIDYYLGMGPMILGHSPTTVAEAVELQVRKGILFGGQSDLEYKAARLVCEMVPCAERVRFTSSGSEAVQATLRMARAATGRKKIIKFEGHYHGWFDNIFWSASGPTDQMGPRDSPDPVPHSLGQDHQARDSIVILPWNDLEIARTEIAKGDIAGVIMEPAMCNSSVIPPAEGYLEGIRKACDESGSVLIFDEVITGFRLAPGGAQERFDVTPDIAILGKAIASGFPVGAIVGRGTLMDLMAGPHKVVHAGTYNGQAVSMAAAVASLEKLKEPATFRVLDDIGGEILEGVKTRLRKHGIKFVVQGWPAIFHVSVGTLGPIVDYRTAASADHGAYVRLAVALLEHGVRVLERGAWFVSLEHESVIQPTLDALDDALAVLDSERVA